MAKLALELKSGWPQAYARWHPTDLSGSTGKIMKYVIFPSNIFRDISLA